MEKMNVVVDGNIVLKSPLHISDPRSARYDPETDKIAYGKVGSPCTLTRHMDFHCPAHMSEKNKSGIFTVPVIPANGLRGTIRRLSSRVIEEHIVNNLDDKINFQTYLGMHCGAITGRPEPGDIAMAEVKGFRDHFFLGLFGGGPRIIPGKLRVATAYPVLDYFIEDLPLIPDNRKIGEQVMSIVDSWRLFQVVPLPRVDDLVQIRDDFAKISVDEYKNVMLNLLEEAEARRKSKKSGEERKSDDKIGLQAINFYQTVIPGTRFYSKFEVDGNPAQVGMLLKGLEKFVQKGIIGGKSACGLGSFMHNFQISIDGLKPEPVFNLKTNTLNMESESIKEIIQIFEEVLDEVNPDSLANLFDVK
ncbi:MAG: type IV CRISPR-associated protein Csf2 [Bacteroidota bacterium]